MWGLDKSAHYWYLHLQLAFMKLMGLKMGIPIPRRWANVLSRPLHQAPETHNPTGILTQRVKSAVAFAFGCFSKFPSLFPPALQHVLQLKLEGDAWMALKCLHV